MCTHLSYFASFNTVERFLLDRPMTPHASFSSTLIGSTPSGFSSVFLLSSACQVPSTRLVLLSIYFCFQICQVTLNTTGMLMIPNCMSLAPVTPQCLAAYLVSSTGLPNRAPRHTVSKRQLLPASPSHFLPLSTAPLSSSLSIS